MKKLLSVLLVFTMLFSAVALVACGGEKETPAASGTVTWKNYDGTSIKVDTNLPGGTMPAFGQADPTRPNDAEGNSYVFDGWDPAPAPVNGDATYTAKYKTVTHTATAGEYAEALDFADQNFTMTETITVGKDSGSISYRQLENNSFVYHRHYNDEAEDDEYMACLIGEDGTYNVYFGDVLTDGTVCWKLGKTGVTKNEVIGELSKICPAFIIEIPFRYYEFDPVSGSYKVNYEGVYVELCFENGKLKNAKMIGEVPIEYVFGDRGTTVIPEAEIADILSTKVVLALDEKNEYFDSEYVPVPGKAGETLEFAVIAAVELPKGFNSETDKIAFGAQFSNEPEEGENTIYTDQKISCELYCGDQKIGEYNSEKKGFIAFINDIVKEEGVYNFRVVVRVLEDLMSTGENRVKVIVGTIGE